MIRGLALGVLAAWTWAADLLVEPAADVLRAQRPLLVDLQWTGLPLVGPVEVDLQAEDAAGLVGRQRIDLADGGQLAWPLTVALVAERPAGPGVRLVVRLRRGAAVAAEAVRPLRSPTSLTISPQASPLEQRLRKDLLAAGEDLSLADLARWDAGFPGWTGLVDPVDGSLQPLRDHPGSQGTVLLLRQPPRDDGGVGARWPDLPVAWRDAARAAGVGVREVFPGGDTTWSGPARGRVRRAAEGLAAPVTVLAVAPVLATAADGLPVVVVAPEELADPAAWRRPATVVPPEPVAPLMAWATGPVTVVVGTGEHAAAASDNAAAAAALQAAWWSWNRGALPQQDDQAALPSTGNLVLVGSTRSNRHLARLLPTGAVVTWTDRVLAVDGRDHLRSLGPSLAWAFPRPGVPGAWVLVLDGPWRWGPLPLPAGERIVRTE